MLKHWVTHDTNIQTNANKAMNSSKLELERNTVAMPPSQKKKKKKKKKKKTRRNKKKVPEILSLKPSIWRKVWSRRSTLSYRNCPSLTNWIRSNSVLKCPWALEKEVSALDSKTKTIDKSVNELKESVSFCEDEIEEMTSKTAALQTSKTYVSSFCI